MLAKLVERASSSSTPIGVSTTRYNDVRFLADTEPPDAEPKSGSERRDDEPEARRSAVSAGPLTGQPLCGSRPGVKPRLRSQPGVHFLGGVFFYNPSTKSTQKILSYTLSATIPRQT